VKLARLRRLKPNVFSHMWSIDLIQIQQYYEKPVTPRGGQYKRVRVKEGN
jgi:hypothetical protein